MSSLVERDYFLAPSDLINFFNVKNYVSNKVSLRKNNSFVSSSLRNANFIGCFNGQNTSVGTGLIPFLEHDDANRALMGSNMQRQALPLKNRELSFIETGIERQIFKASELNLTANASGIVVFSSNKKLVVFSELAFSEKERKVLISQSKKTFLNKSFLSQSLESLKFKKNFYYFSDFRKSNQGNIINHSSFLKVGDWVKKGDFIVDGNCSLAGKVCYLRQVFQVSLFYL